MSVFLFLLVLFVLVLVHEWGHFITAKKTGMRVDEFAIGFPPRLFGIKRGETAYNFNLLPIGGYVKIFGENSEEALTEEDAADRARAFGARPKWAQAIVLLAGIAMNILFAWLLFTIVLIVGVPTAVEEQNASESAELIVAGTLPDSPASAVLPVGASILSVSSGNNSVAKPTPSEFSGFVTQSAPDPIMVTYRDHGEEKTVTITPVKGLVQADSEKYIVGTSLSLVEVKKEPIHLAVIDGFTMTTRGIEGITVGLYSLIKESFVGKANFENVAGPIGIVGMVGDAASYGLAPLLMFTAMISLNLAVINLLPFPALDGGRLMFVGIEAITRKQVPAKWMGWTNLIGFMLLMILMAAVTFNDITRLL